MCTGAAAREEARAAADWAAADWAAVDWMEATELRSRIALLEDAARDCRA